MKYFFDQDDDGHWFMIPEVYRTEWDNWKTAWENARPGKPGPNLPMFAEELGSHPRNYTFTHPDRA